MDLTSLSTINYIKNKYGFHMSKGLGQNFLTDANVLEQIADAAELNETSGALEIGPGIGVLTNVLAKRAKKVTAVEIDTRLLPVLDETLAEHDNVQVINCDFMKVDLKKLIAEQFDGIEHISLAANLPYYITTPILTSVLENRDFKFDNIVVMVQKEVALRLCAKPGKKDYSALSVLVNYYTEPEIVVHVPAASFVPAPKVDSAVVKMKMLDRPRVTPKDEAVFFKTVRAAFGHRRKTLLNALSTSNAFSRSKEEYKAIIAELGFKETVRGEELSLEDFCALADLLTEA